MTPADKAVILLIWFVALLVAERAWPVALAAPLTEQRWRRWGRNFGLFLTSSVGSFLVVAPLTLFYCGLELGLRPPVFSGALGFASDLLLLDLSIYWWHRLNHRVPLLWRFHRVHHLDEHLDTSSGVRFHAIEVLLSGAFRGVAITLWRIPLSSVVAFETVLLCCALFQHSNLRLPARFERALSILFVTPSIHWVHHHREPQDTNSNYATVLSVWDRLFGSRSATPRTPQLSIGLDGQRDLGLFALLRSPFRWVHGERA